MNLLIKNFPDETQKALKIMAIRQGIAVTRLIIEILKEKTEGENVV